MEIPYSNVDVYLVVEVENEKNENGMNKMIGNSWSEETEGSINFGSRELRCV